MARIVICEDNAQICRMLERGLAQDGNKITVTSTVRDCLGSLEQGIPDLVLIDILLQGENALALIRQLRATYRDLTIIAMTGAGHELAHAAVAQGADGVLAKPFLLETLEALIGNLARTKKSSPA